MTLDKKGLIKLLSAAKIIRFDTKLGGCALAMLKNIKIKILLIFLLLFTASGVFAQESKPAISEIDRIRLAEAFRIGEALGNKIWKDWDKAPFAVLLVTPENEFLIRHPKPSEDFTFIGFDSLLKSGCLFSQDELSKSIS